MRSLLATKAFVEARSVWLYGTLAVWLAAIFSNGLDNSPRTGNVVDDMHPFAGAPFAELLDTVFSSMARWDSVHYLGIANEGYVGGPGEDTEIRSGFFPLYPFLIRLLSFGGAHPAAALIAGYVISIGSYLVALWLLYRLVMVEVGKESVARATLILLACSPFAFYFVAVYTESLFLALIIGAFYAARTGHWAWAGALGALASASRVPGIAVLGPLVVLYFYGPRADRPPLPRVSGMRAMLPRYAPRWDVLWLALVPLGIGAYSAYLARARGDGLAWLHSQGEQGVTGQHSFFPFQGIWEGADRFFTELALLASKDPTTIVKIDVFVNFGALVLIAIGIVGVWRKLGFAYAACALAFIAVPLSATTIGDPLKSFARYATIAFPLFIYLAIVAERRGWTYRIAGAFAVLLIVQTATFARWQWVA